MTSAPEPRGQELPESLPVADLLGLLADLPDDEYVCIIPQKRLIAQAERIRKLEDFAGKSLVLNREIARLQREAEGLRRENQELRAAHYDATEGISGTLLRDQVEALTRERDEARRDYDGLRTAALFALPVLSDRAAGGKMITPREHAADAFRRLKAACAHPDSETQG